MLQLNLNPATPLRALSQYPLSQHHLVIPPEFYDLFAPSNSNWPCCCANNLRPLGNLTIDERSDPKAGRRRGRSRDVGSGLVGTSMVENFMPGVTEQASPVNEP